MFLWLTGLNNLWLPCVKGSILEYLIQFSWWTWEEDENSGLGILLFQSLSHVFFWILLFFYLDNMGVKILERQSFRTFCQHWRSKWWSWSGARNGSGFGIWVCLCYIEDRVRWPSVMLPISSCPLCAPWVSRKTGCCPVAVECVFGCEGYILVFLLTSCILLWYLEFKLLLNYTVSLVFTLWITYKILYQVNVDINSAFL